MKYQVDCTGFSMEQLQEVFMTLPQHANVKVMLFWEERPALMTCCARMSWVMEASASPGKRSVVQLQTIR